MSHQIARVLIYTTTKDKIFKFYVKADRLPSLKVELDDITRYQQHIIQKVCTELQLTETNRLSLVCHNQFCQQIKVEPEQNEWLYLLKVEPEKIVSQFQLLSMPEVLRTMEKNRTRLAYLKAWQFLMGAHQSDLTALEVRRKT